MSRSPMYHVGIVVRDLDEAMARLTQTIGATWGPIVENEAMHLRDADGTDLTVRSRLCYSTEAPYLELIEEQPGTPWVCNEFSNLHHIGFFSDDLVADSDSIVDASCPMELAGRVGDKAPVTFTYHTDPLRVRIEHVDVAMRPTLENWMCKPPKTENV